MKSKESQVAAQVRLKQWVLEVQDCMNRPKDMTVDEWCEQHNIKKANYYWRLKRVRQTCLEQVETTAGNFVELPAPVPCELPAPTIPVTASATSSTMAVLRATNGISIEIMEGATAEFLKSLMGAVAHAE